MLAKGTSNIILVNLVTGAPHAGDDDEARPVRAVPALPLDGWFYFLVRDQNSGKEYAVASDAALQ